MCVIFVRVPLENNRVVPRVPVLAVLAVFREPLAPFPVPSIPLQSYQNH
ncbi:MAG: hypothetical protein LBN42_02450 [Oscillospiraceae bacterium]|nr:hypothetical protein [Oscillospiraceae bacterium]